MYHFNLVARATAKGSTPGKPNEDGFVVAPDVFAMIDGATGRAKKDRRFINLVTYGSDAQWLTAATIQRLKTHPLPEPDLRDAIRTLATAMQQEFGRVCTKYPDTERIEVPSAALGMARLHGDQLQITSLADVGQIVIFKNGQHQVIPCKTHPNEPELNRRIGAYQREHQCSFADAFAAHIDFYRYEIAEKSNKPGYWGVLNTWDLPLDECFGPYEQFDAAQVARVIQFTDGVDDRFGTFTIPDLIAAASSNKQLADIIAQIRAAEQADAHAERVPRAKQSDDATIAVVDIVPSL